ncbi:hypothetical protein HYY75_03730 [bacterium]|nr:hypothetical protein [bacterium]
MKVIPRGVTLIEVSIGAFILALVVGAVYKLTISGQKSAAQIMQSHQVNEEVQNAIDRFSSDVREANVIVDNVAPDHEPPLLDVAQNQSVDAALFSAIQGRILQTENPKNKLKLIKCQIVPPSQILGATLREMFKKYQVEYFFKGTGSTKALVRKFVELDNQNNEVPASAKIKPLIYEINTNKDYAVFFRIGGSQGLIGSRNVYFAAEISRKEKKGDGSLIDKSTFRSTILTSAHIRGSAPDKY